MSRFISKLAKKIFNSKDYENASELLFGTYVLQLTGEHKKLERVEVSKLVSAAQIFHKSDDECIRKEGAIILSMLLDVCSSENPEIVPIANSVFSSIGDFPNINLLKQKYPKIDFKYDFHTEAEFDFRKHINTVPELNITLTNYQRSLWDDLTAGEDIITIAPTSAGKTHIILSYLMDEIAKSNGAFAAVIVPTRALISEVAGKIHELAQTKNIDAQIEICTVPKDGLFGNKTFFVMTQERLYEILQSGDIYFNYLFIDEAHNIADKSRGVLLHLTIEKMLEDSSPQIIISMPSASYQDSFSTIFRDVEFKKEITNHSPVSKVIMKVAPKGRELVISRLNSSNKKIVKKGFNDKRLADIVFKLGKGQGNIIYRNQTDHCERLANDISNLIEGISESPLLEEAADYVEKFIHRDFTLANNLRKGVAFHYGPLPGSIRIMVENLVKDDEIKFVACTSTLAEGVNLPAKNLFLKNPIQKIMHQPSERLEDVKISNITGRAGRMMQHFSGNIFLIEPDDWLFKDYFENNNDDNEEKIPTYFKTLNDDFSFIIKALEGEYDHDEKHQYRYYAVANKLLKEYANDNLSNTLNAPELILGKKQLNFLESKVVSAFSSLKVTSFTLEASPTVGYIQQNKLFSFLNSKSDFESWVLPHPKSEELFPALYNICEKLKEFGIYIPSEEYTLNYICLITKKWLQGHSLKEIISEQINWENNNLEKTSNVNSAVRNVIKVINNDIRFRLSNALRCYHVLLTNILATKGLEVQSIKLHYYIEIGACEERMIALINLGLSREAAKEIDGKLPKRIKMDNYNDLMTLKILGILDSLHPITVKELTYLLKLK